MTYFGECLTIVLFVVFCCCFLFYFFRFNVHIQNKLLQHSPVMGHTHTHTHTGTHIHTYLHTYIHTTNNKQQTNKKHHLTYIIRLVFCFVRVVVVVVCFCFLFLFSIVLKTI